MLGRLIGSYRKYEASLDLPGEEQKKLLGLKGTGICRGYAQNERQEMDNFWLVNKIILTKVNGE
jgi:hypothetical protein